MSRLALALLLAAGLASPGFAAVDLSKYKKQPPAAEAPAPAPAPAAAPALAPVPAPAPVAVKPVPAPAPAPVAAAPAPKVVPPPAPAPVAAKPAPAPVAAPVPVKPVTAAASPAPAAKKPVVAKAKPDPKLAAPVATAGIVAVGPAPKPEPVKLAAKQPSIDDVFAQRNRDECEKLAISFVCREKIRFQLCDGKWSEHPGAGEKACLQTKSTTN